MRQPPWDAPPPLPSMTPGALTAYRLPAPAPYLPLWRWQRTLAQARGAGAIDDLLLLLEHEHVYTLGRHGRNAHLLADVATLARLGATCHRVDRGGDITYHGPGQLVGYPIVALAGAGRRVRDYVAALETALIATAAHFGVTATAARGLTGIWVGDEKLAAIGIRVSHGVAYHGFALNVATDLAYFRHIVPCGLAGKGVTSLTALLGHPVAVDAVIPVCARAVATALDLPLAWSAPPPPIQAWAVAVSHQEASA